MDAAVARGRGARLAPAQGRGKTRKREPVGLGDPETPPHVMRLHILSGSFFEFPLAGDGDDANPGGGLGGSPMDTSVWSRLPDDMVWRVLGFLPVAKLFQLQAVSRKWRQVLTSPYFRKQEQLQRRQQQPVLACVTAPDSSSSLCHSDSSSSSKAKKVVDVDLSFVLKSFWTRHERGCRCLSASYSVVAAGDGLVCICNDLSCECQCELRKLGTRYCVLNPVTRTCVVLPPAPFKQPALMWHDCGKPPGWLPPFTSAVTVCRWKKQVWERDACWEVATCDLAPVAGRRRWTVLRNSTVTRMPWGSQPPVMARCGGETFWYHAGRLHVLAPAPAPAETGGAKRRRVGGAVASPRLLDAVDGPSVALLGLDDAAVGYLEERSFMVAHRGTVLFVAQLMRRGGACGRSFLLELSVSRPSMPVAAINACL